MTSTAYSTSYRREAVNQHASSVATRYNFTLVTCRHIQKPPNK